MISADGHPVGGSLMFSIGAPSAQPAADADSRAERGVRTALWAVKVVLYVGLFAGIGGAFFCAWFAEPVSRRRSEPWLLMLLTAGLIAAPASVALQGVDALDLPLAGLTRKLSWETGLETSYGLTAIAAAFALFAGLFACLAESSRLARGLALLGLLGVGLALSLSGHASTAQPQLLSRPALFLHAVCVAFWIGALLPLALGARDAVLRAAPPAVGELRRFSNAIVPVVVLLVLTGLWLAFVQLDRIDALWTTNYGRVLAGKLAAVIVLFALAAANRYWLVPKFESSGRRGGAAVRNLDRVRACHRVGDPGAGGAVALHPAAARAGRRTRRSPCISMERRPWPRSRSSGPSSEARRRACWCSMARSSRSPPRRLRWCSPIPPQASSPSA